MVDTTRMTAAEFRHLPESNIQLIHGEVVVSPSPKAVHQEISRRLVRQLLASLTEGDLFYAPMDVYLDEENVVQPDVFWVSGPESRCQRGEDDYWHGPPDLAAEIISPGTERQDKVTKFALYEQHGVREYWLLDPAGSSLEVWHLEESSYTRVGLFTEAFESQLLGVSIAVTDLF